MASKQKSLRDTSCGAGKFLKFFVLLVLGFVNISVDWFFYTRVNLIEPGLIYGPPDKNLKLIIFIFCVVATVGFVFEVVHHLDDLAHKRRIKCLSQSLMNFISIVFTHLPLIILNLIITACHDGKPTLISLIKSSVCITMITVRFVYMLSYRCCRAEKKKSRFKCVTDIMSLVGLFLILLASIKIQLLNFFLTHSPASLPLIQNPLRFKQTDFIRDKYLYGVGIYAKWPLSDPSNRTLNSDLKAGDDQAQNYLWLANINDVIDETFFQVIIRSNFSGADSNYVLCLTKQKQLEECFLMNQNSGYFHHIAAESLPVQAKKSEYLIMITKEPAQAYRYLLGYLDYKMTVRHKDSDSCETSRIESVVYAKFLPSSENAQRQDLKAMGGRRYAFYNHNIDLQTVDKLWRTGVFNCHMSGDLGPKFNAKIPVVC